MKKDAQDIRIIAVIGEYEDSDFEEAVNLFYQHLKNNLSLPCNVTGVEDFSWEEFYVFGPGDKVEYEHLKKTQPSYTDKFELIDINRDIQSEWIPYEHGDITAHVKRISDGKEFVLALSELKATDKQSKDYQLLDDYSVWFVNSH